MKLPLLIGLLVAGAPIAATGQTTEGPRPERVQVTPGVVEAEVGQTIRFTAEAFDASGARLDAKPSTWFAAPFDVGGADQEGLVTMFAPGELRVGAIINGKPGWATVRIKPQQVASLAIAPPPSLVPGATARLEARTFTKDGIPREGVPVTWSIAPASVAAIDAAGVVTAKAPGTATVTAKSEAGVTTARLVVAANNLRPDADRDLFDDGLAWMLAGGLALGVALWLARVRVRRSTSTCWCSVLPTLTWPFATLVRSAWSLPSGFDVSSTSPMKPLSEVNFPASPTCPPLSP